MNGGLETKLWKFSLVQTSLVEQRYMWPHIVQFIDLQMQDGIPVLWALVHPDSPKRLYKIMRFLTGDTVYGVTRHLGTVTDDCGDVLHYFSGGPGL
jgi:hypothetical protein